MQVSTEWGFVAYYTDGHQSAVPADWNIDPMDEETARAEVEAFNKAEDKMYPEFDGDGEPNTERECHLTYRVRWRHPAEWVTES